MEWKQKKRKTTKHKKQRIVTQVYGEEEKKQMSFVKWLLVFFFFVPCVQDKNSRKKKKTNKEKVYIDVCCLDKKKTVKWYETWRTEKGMCGESSVAARQIIVIESKKKGVTAPTIWLVAQTLPRKFHFDCSLLQLSLSHNTA